MRKVYRKAPYKTEIPNKGLDVSCITPEGIKLFWSRVSKIPNEKGCLLWLGWVSPEGYGRFRIPGKWPVPAHRVAFFLHKGYCHPHLLVRHLCGNPACCNPEHLEEGTVADNSADTIRHGRSPRGDRHGFRIHPEAVLRGDDHWTRHHPDRIASGDKSGARLRPESCPRGEKHGMAKLTEASVIEIRRRRDTGETLSSLGKAFGVSLSTIHLICTRKKWKQVP